MLFNMERVKRHVPFDVWDKIRTLILAEPEKKVVRLSRMAALATARALGEAQFIESWKDLSDLYGQLGVEIIGYGVEVEPAELAPLSRQKDDIPSGKNAPPKKEDQCS